MSDINVNITPTTIPASTRSQSSSVTSESVQHAVSAVHVAEVSLPPTTVVEKESEKHQLSAEGVKAAAAVGDSVLRAINKDLQFQVDDATKQVVVKIIDSKTGKVIRQIPTVEMLDFIRVMKEQEANTGKLYQAKA
jgi:flagellar protein FlaG